jgi:hypothetical protein
LNEPATGARPYEGLPQSIMEGLADEDSALHGSCAAMRTSGGRLLESAQSAVRIREDVTVHEVIALVLGLAWAAQQQAGPSDLLERLLSSAMYGPAVS